MLFPFLPAFLISGEKPAGPPASSQRAVRQARWTAAMLTVWGFRGERALPGSARVAAVLGLSIPALPTVAEDLCFVHCQVLAPSSSPDSSPRRRQPMLLLFPQQQFLCLERRIGRFLAPSPGWAARGWDGEVSCPFLRGSSCHSLPSPSSRRLSPETADLCVNPEDRSSLLAPQQHKALLHVREHRGGGRPSSLWDRPAPVFLTSTSWGPMEDDSPGVWGSQWLQTVMLAHMWPLRICWHFNVSFVPAAIPSLLCQ